MSIAKRAFSSVNAAEIEYFSKLSAQWWDLNGEFSLLHKMNPVRMQFIREKLTEVAIAEKTPIPDSVHPLKGLNVLDVGCGGGILSEALARAGARTLGIDASESNIAIAETHASQDSALTTLNYRATVAENLIKEGKQYDVVCSMEVIEHVDNPFEFLAAVASLVKPNGHLFLSTINRTFFSWFLTIFMAERVLRLVTPGLHHHEKYIKPSEMFEFFASNKVEPGPWVSPYTGQPSLKEAELRGLIFNPLSPKTWFLGARNGSAFSTASSYVVWLRKPPASTSQ